MEPQEAPKGPEGPRKPRRFHEALPQEAPGRPRMRQEPPQEASGSLRKFQEVQNKPLVWVKEFLVKKLRGSLAQQVLFVSQSMTKNRMVPCPALATKS